MAGAECTVCSGTGARYKCPRCLARYCSVACFKRHKEDLCEHPAENGLSISPPSPFVTTHPSTTDHQQHQHVAPASSPVISTTAENLSKEVDKANRIERLLRDIPEESRLRKSALECLGSSEVAGKLSDPTTRSFIANVMESRDRREAHERLRGFISQSPAFSDFSSSCLNLVNKRDDT
ncbi:hypothetical protein RvY_13900 [Ramazzottius varieornatus]|uniref:HIT-type domain-containing protein n=1 Tax=Ramazzottius varieornatus TaxID=947166 RepID=A0A1D1VTF1_RAMVA|nr:hypothetical protein RvY_13900 [Ramazzottius varieornatus]